MNDLPCNTCIEKLKGCERTVCKAISAVDKTIVNFCGDYVPVVRCCDNCIRDGSQLVDRKCLHCTNNPTGKYDNFEARK